MLELDPLPPEEVQQAIFRRLVEGNVPDSIKAGSGVFLRCEPELHESIAAALNNLVGFDLARRSMQRCMRHDRSARLVLPDGKLLTGRCKHAKHAKKRARAKATSKVDAWIVSLSFDGTLVYWHAQLGESHPEIRYSIKPSGRLVARALMQSYAAASGPKSPDVGSNPESATVDEVAGRIAAPGRANTSEVTADGPNIPPLRQTPNEGEAAPKDPIPITWLRKHVPQGKVGGDASKLAKWLERRNVRVFKIARRNHGEREALLGMFKAGSRVHDLIKEYVADGG